MRKIVSLLAVAGLATGLTLATVTPSGASVSAKTSRFCKLVQSLPDAIGDPTSKKDARKTAAVLRRLERAAKGKTKAAVSEIADAYGEFADGSSAGKAFGNEDFVKAAARFALAAAKCLLDDLPDITLPDLPS